MKTYQVIERIAGAIEATHDFVTALTAADAVAVIEVREEYEQFKVGLSGKGKEVKYYTWTRREFEVREMKRVLS